MYIHMKNKMYSELNHFILNRNSLLYRLVVNINLWLISKSKNSNAHRFPGPEPTNSWL